MLIRMKTFLSTLAISGMLVSVCYAQDSGPSSVIQPITSGSAKEGSSNADQAAYYATLNRRVVEFTAQSELLSQLSQEHKKRAQEAPRDQIAKAQWESELAKELDDKALVILGLLNNIRKERLTFEQAHADLLSSIPPNSPARESNTRNLDEAVFMAKLEERLAAVQQEVAEAMDAGMVYTAQLQTNTRSADYSRITSLLQDNGNTVKRLQKEAANLELKKLEFRALRRD
jgi:hypothetical protein